MPSISGTFEQKGTGRPFGFRIEYEVVGRTINYKADISAQGASVASPSGQFDFDASRLDPRDAVVSFVQGQVDQVNLGDAPDRP
ncbi:hypothetical protein [Piscinibacter koreensis]|uniref:Uncharacterized protein n=1 Tax=Piscinibacter koreensis TaxID=2742824 RepID=A0A7Y6NMQ8_9BURK|nr:hypothetical protein [Schlegelella koreensis]NUZ05917.1 hypothetical protein [Schlegelella koreensis]